LIEAYSFGNIVIDGAKYTSDLIISGEKIRVSWRRKEGHVLHISDIEYAVEEFQPEAVVIGTGYAGMMEVPAETARYFQAKGIELLVEKTEKACMLINTLSNSKRILAALHLTC